MGRHHSLRTWLMPRPSASALIMILRLWSACPSSGFGLKPLDRVLPVCEFSDSLQARWHQQEHHKVACHLRDEVQNQCRKMQMAYLSSHEDMALRCSNPIIHWVHPNLEFSMLFFYSAEGKCHKMRKQSMANVKLGTQVHSWQQSRHFPVLNSHFTIEQHDVGVLT